MLGPDTVTTEGVSKTVFIKGVRDGLRLLDTLADIDAVVVDAAGKLFYSRGLREENGR